MLGDQTTCLVELPFQSLIVDLLRGGVEGLHGEGQEYDADEDRGDGFLGVHEFSFQEWFIITSAFIASSQHAKMKGLVEAAKLHRVLPF